MIMGESDASTPVIILRGMKIKFTNRPILSESLGIDSKYDIYIRGLTGKIS
jgi:F420-0:gamma-glutamyl ligase